MTRPQNLPKPRPITACACGDHVFVALNGPYITLVSPEDRDLLEARAWSVSSHEEGRKRYACASSKMEGALRLHREVMRKVYGRNLKRNEYVDHIDGWSLDNRRNCTIRNKPQLRLSCPITNGQNKQPRKLACHTRIPGVKGVYLVEGAMLKPYRARIMSRGELHSIGYFATLVEAAAAYNEKAKEVHGDFACLNDLDAIAAKESPALVAAE